MKRRGWSGGTGDYRHFEREVAIMAKREKRMVAPLVDIRHDYKDTGFTINGGFCVKGEGDDFRYESCFMLAHEVKPDKAKAKFDAGLLTIHVPFNETWRGHKVPIER
jgi:hypothetical protein